MRDPYQVLGVAKTATEAEIKSAYRKLAKKYHPDHNTNDPKAKERFAEANNAYEIVGDADKRKKFDAGEIDAEGKPRFQGFEGFQSGGGRPGHGAESFSFGFGSGGGPFAGRGQGGDPSDILSDLLRGFGGPGAGPGPHAQARNQPGRDITGEVSVTLEEIASGTTKRVAVQNGRVLEVKIPAWIGDGKTIRLSGQGQASPRGGRPGDVLLTVRYLPHAVFTPEGHDLKARVGVPLVDAVLGGSVRIPTLEGEVEMNLPAWSTGGKSFRLRGKGLKGESARGDLIVAMDIKLPDGDADLTALMQRKRSER